MWTYRDANRVGYDSIGSNYYLEKPFGFNSSKDSQTAYYEADIPDTYTIEEEKLIGEKTVKLLVSGYYSNAQRAVDTVLLEKK